MAPQRQLSLPLAILCYMAVSAAVILAMRPALVPIAFTLRPFCCLYCRSAASARTDISIMTIVLMRESSLLVTAASLGAHLLVFFEFAFLSLNIFKKKFFANSDR